MRHYYMGTYTPEYPRWADSFGLGYIGVHLFLLLSGFCVAWAYVGARQQPFVAREYIRRRATRILPAYYVALAISLLLAPAAMDWSYARLLLVHVTMLHNLSTDTVMAINGVFWSLALECQLYLTFPIFLWASRRRRLVSALALALGIQLAYRVVVAMLWGTDYNDATMVLPWSVVGRMFEFGLGVWAAQVIALGGPARWRWARALPLFAVVSFAGAILAKRTLGVSSPVTDLCFTVGFAALLLQASRAGTWTRRMLECRPLVFVGAFSYSLYLVHGFVLHWLCPAIAALPLSATVRIAMFVPASIAAIAVSYGFYRAVEKPAMNYFGRKRSVRDRDLARGV